MKIAALDLGTNTFLLLIAEVETGASLAQARIVQVLHDEARVVRLGQDVNRTQRLHPEALARAGRCFEDYRQTIQKHGVQKILACATSAARDAQNKDELLKLAAQSGIPLKIISGEDEARLAFFGTINGVPEAAMPEDIVLVDIGGGSTEFIYGSAAGIKLKMSLDIGSVRMTERFLTSHPPPPGECTALSQYIDEQLARLPNEFRDIQSRRIQVIAVAGTATTLATLDQGLEFESDRVDGHRLAAGRAAELAAQLAKMSVIDRQKLAGMEPQRADVIFAGSLILSRAEVALGCQGFQISIRGLRYGIAKALANQNGNEMANQLANEPLKGE